LFHEVKSRVENLLPVVAQSQEGVHVGQATTIRLRKVWVSPLESCLAAPVAKRTP
jgi:hypothetical protein